MSEGAVQLLGALTACLTGLVGIVFMLCLCIAGGAAMDRTGT